MPKAAAHTGCNIQPTDTHIIEFFENFSGGEHDKNASLRQERFLEKITHLRFVFSGRSEIDIQKRTAGI